MNKKFPTDKPIRSKLLTILTGLDKFLLIRFQKQLGKEGSTNRDVMVIFNYCLKHHPNCKQPAFYQKFAYQKIFKEEFNYVRLMRGLSNIFLRLEQYLIAEELKENDFFKDYLLANAYNRYKLTSPFQQIVSKKTAEQVQGTSLDNCLEQLTWNHLAYFSGIHSKIEEESTDLKKASTSLDLYFVGIKLRHLCELASRKIVLGEDYSDEFEEMIMAYCQKMKRTYLQEQYVLYQFGINKKILLINERFIKDHFINLTYISSYLEEFDWLYELLAEWEAQIKNWFPENTFYSAMARLTFAQGFFIKLNNNGIHDHDALIKHN